MSTIPKINYREWDELFDSFLRQHGARLPQATADDSGWGAELPLDTPHTTVCNCSDCRLAGMYEEE